MKNLKHKIKSVLARLGILMTVFRAYEKIKSLKPQPPIPIELNNGLPIPSPDLMVLVAGSPDPSWFLKIGKEGADNIVEVLKKNTLDITKFDSILDFGCGCGRVLRYWKDLQGVKIFGTDYNKKLITWCSNNLHFAKFNINELKPPLIYGSNSFEFVYALSVFTHLTEFVQLDWLKELRRVLKPDGYLFMTTQGEYYLNKLNEKEKKDFKDGHLVVKYPETEGSNLCSAYHPLAYIEREFTKYFEIVDFINMGAKGNPWQDVILLKKPLN